MAHPDALISAVGTKVYRFEAGSWQEDMAWSATLDQGWNAEAVREACYEALAMVGRVGLGAACGCLGCNSEICSAVGSEEEQPGGRHVVALGDRWRDHQAFS